MHGGREGIAMKILRIYNRVTKEAMMPPREVIESYGNSEFFILEVGDHVLYIRATCGNQIKEELP